MTGYAAAGLATALHRSNPHASSRRVSAGCPSGVARASFPSHFTWARFVETSGGIVAGLSGRYATALFDLAREDKSLDAVAASLATLKTALADSVDLRTLANSPRLDRASAGRGIAAVAESLQLDGLTAKFLGVLAANRRLRDLTQIIRDFEALAARQRGQVTATVTSAVPLSNEQQDAVRASLKQRLRQDVALDLRVDKDILGGLVVRTGSQLIDSSIRTKLNTLAQAMKG